MKGPNGLKFYKNFGFTIVELIIAISIIGILAVIVSVSYTGLDDRAIESTIKSDLSNVLGELNLFKTEKNKYPTAINDCPNTDVNKICLKLSGDNEYQYTVDNSSSPKTFLLVVSNGDLAYFIDNTSNKPTKLLADSIITSIGAISGTTRDGETLSAGTITPSGATVTYQWKRADTSGGTYTNISGATSSTYLLSSQDVNKYIKVTAMGVGSYTGVVTSLSVGAIQSIISPPSTPTVTVALSSPNVLATASIVTCTTGTAQYGLRSRTNDGTWSAYSAWSTTRTASQTANDGVKYGYQAQARCYVDASSSSSTVTSTESTYIDPIPTPSALTVSNTSTSTTTTWSWTPTTCPTGTSARYQYRYTNSQGYDSGLVATTSTSVSFTTSTESVTYTVSVQKQCYNSNTTSNWSTATSSSYTRPSSGIAVTGGTESIDGSYTVRTFTSSGTLSVTNGTLSGVSVLIVGGGAYGQRGGVDYGGAGGNGGQVVSLTNQSVTGDITVSVGTSNQASSFGLSNAIAGGGAAGGSSVYWGLGNPGSNGTASNITGSTVYYGGGGGAGSFNGVGANGGLGGGGKGGDSTEDGSSWGTCYNGVAGLANTGGGGGGSGAEGVNMCNDIPGGSGVVIVRYLSP